MFLFVHLPRRMGPTFRCFDSHCSDAVRAHPESYIHRSPLIQRLLLIPLSSSVEVGDKIVDQYLCTASLSRQRIPPRNGFHFPVTTSVSPIQSRPLRDHVSADVTPETIVSDRQKCLKLPSCASSSSSYGEILVSTSESRNVAP